MRLSEVIITKTYTVAVIVFKTEQLLVGLFIVLVMYKIVRQFVGLKMQFKNIFFLFEIVFVKLLTIA